METGLSKPMNEMSNRKLFCVLTGEYGIMAQMQLQNVVKAYIKQYSDDADLQTMVRVMVEQGERTTD